MPVIFVGAIALGIAQLWAAFAGADLYVGWIFASIIFAACFMFRFTAPITVFAFLGAVYVWEWPWYWALLFIAPGLLLVIPGFLAQIVGTLSATTRGR